MKIESQIIRLEKHRTDTSPMEYNLTISGNGTKEECELMQSMMLNFDKNEKTAFINGKTNMSKYVIKALSSILLREDYGKEISDLRDVLLKYDK